jgi:hypothetical protein
VVAEPIPGEEEGVEEKVRSENMVVVAVVIGYSGDSYRVVVDRSFGLQERRKARTYKGIWSGQTGWVIKVAGRVGT